MKALVNKGIQSTQKNGIVKTCLKACSYLYANVLRGCYRIAHPGREEPVFDSVYQQDKPFVDRSTDIKALAFYLPQFHTIPENDAWWGEGYTEWTNARKAEPRFSEHYQPRVPHHDFGYYSLLDHTVIKKQTELAARHGIWGFCWYYYWFSGKRLLEQPLDLMLSHTEIDFPFCLCWANENWTRTWDGQQNDVLMRQKYAADDAEKFILNIQKYLLDRRYIRIDGKPVILVYNPDEIPDFADCCKTWRATALKCGIGEIVIWCCLHYQDTLSKLNAMRCVDGTVEFPPHNVWCAYLDMHMKFDARAGAVYNYEKLVDLNVKRLKKPPRDGLPIYPTAMVGWDNSSRREKDWRAFYPFSLSSFYKWIRSAADYSRRNFPADRRFLFINAWNEWTEGTYLEPDARFGYASINTFSRAIYQEPLP